MFIVNRYRRGNVRIFEKRFVRQLIGTNLFDVRRL